MCYIPDIEFVVMTLKWSPASQVIIFTWTDACLSSNASKSFKIIVQHDKFLSNWDSWIWRFKAIGSYHTLPFSY